MKLGLREVEETCIGRTIVTKNEKSFLILFDGLLLKSCVKLYVYTLFIGEEGEHLYFHHDFAGSVTQEFKNLGPKFFNICFYPVLFGVGVQETKNLIFGGKCPLGDLSKM